jgi:hypothetical protein
MCEISLCGTKLARRPVMFNAGIVGWCVFDAGGRNEREDVSAESYRAFALGVEKGDKRLKCQLTNSAGINEDLGKDMTRTKWGD